MPDKRTLQRTLARLKRVKTWQLVIILLLMSLVAATLLRMNNLGMVERREAVIVADEKGDKAAIKTALVELQAYVTSHMNTDLGNGVYLVKTYERDRAAALRAAENTDNPNAEAYQQASLDCRSRFQGGVESFRNDYVQCVIERVSALEGQDDPPSLRLPKADTYRYDFVSPLISLDAAGIAVLTCLFITSVILLRLITLAVIRLLLRRHYHGV